MATTIWLSHPSGTCEWGGNRSSWIERTDADSTTGTSQLQENLNTPSTPSDQPTVSSQCHFQSRRSSRLHTVDRFATDLNTAEADGWRSNDAALTSNARWLAKPRNIELQPSNGWSWIDSALCAPHKLVINETVRTMRMWSDVWVASESLRSDKLSMVISFWEHTAGCWLHSHASSIVTIYSVEKR